jgi:hypothetical protein
VDRSLERVRIEHRTPETFTWTFTCTCTRTSTWTYTWTCRYTADGRNVPVAKTRRQRPRVSPTLGSLNDQVADGALRFKFRDSAVHVHVFRVQACRSRGGVCRVRTEHRTPMTFTWTFTCTCTCTYTRTSTWTSTWTWTYTRTYTWTCRYTMDGRNVPGCRAIKLGSHQARVRLRQTPAEAAEAARRPRPGQTPSGV